MAERDDSIKKVIKAYLEAITQKNINVEKAYLFGSYARGRAEDSSDIDIAIISKDFSGERFIDRRLIVPLRREIDRRLEPIPYHPDNFKENDPLVLEILQNGIEIAY